MINQALLELLRQRTVALDSYRPSISDDFFVGRYEVIRQISPIDYLRGQLIDERYREVGFARNLLELDL